MSAVFDSGRRGGPGTRMILPVVLLTLLGLLGVPSAGRADVPDPVVTGPIGDAGIRGYALWDSWVDLSDYGYQEDEYFVSGTASNATGGTADYTTRIIVTRPSDPDDFSGSIMLDWVNVTAQFENAVDSAEAHEFLRREGWAFVHVSAQAAGVCCTPLTPKIWDPLRYESLSHPGDAYANDMFSQIARAIDAPADVDPLNGLPRPVQLIAAGQSQSASRLHSYVRTSQAAAGIIDGFLIHGGGSKDHPVAPAVPVLHLLSDAEASPAAPTATANYRLWEVAGTAHSDFWIGYHQELGQGPRFAGAPKRPASDEAALHEVAGNYGEQPHPMHGTCIFAGAAFPMRYSVSAALFHLGNWVREPSDEHPEFGAPPPEAPRYAFSGSTLARDAHGNALGGIRLPPIDVPVASYVSTSCALGGITVPFTEAQLRLLYPTHAEYYALMKERTHAAVHSGFLLDEDAQDLLARACRAKSRWQEIGSADCD